MPLTNNTPLQITAKQFTTSIDTQLEEAKKILLKNNAYRYFKLTLIDDFYYQLGKAYWKDYLSKRPDVVVRFINIESGKEYGLCKDGRLHPIYTRGTYLIYYDPK